MTYILFDIGGTKIRVAVSSDLKKITDTKKFSTPKDPNEAMALIVAAAKELTNGPIIAIAGGIRGILNEYKTGIIQDSTLSSWANFDIVAKLTEEFSVPVYLENDAALAGLGEAHYGAGQGVDILVYHTISTGVGGVKISYGKIDESSMGFEPGHQILDIDRTILGPDIVPTLQNLVSGTAVEARMGMKAYEIPQVDVLWTELAGYLAQGMRNSILYWSPEVIVLGGSMMVGDPKIPIEAVRKATVAALDNFVPCPFITTAALLDDAGLYGAMARINQVDKN